MIVAKEQRELKLDKGLAFAKPGFKRLRQEDHT